MCSKGIHTAVHLHIFITIFHSMEDHHHHILIPVAYQNFHLLLTITQFFLQVKSILSSCFVPFQELFFLFLFCSSGIDQWALAS